MDMLRVEAAIVRALLPDLVLREGMRVVASVAERAGRRGIIVLAGTPLAAQLPDEVQVGDVLRLIVAETTPERVVLRIADAQQPPAAVIGLPLPDGSRVRITVAERDADGASGARDREQHEVRLTYASARLGTLDLHLALTGDALRIEVRARAGVPYELAERNAAELQQAIAASTGRSVQVRVSPRHDPLDVYA